MVYPEKGWEAHQKGNNKNEKAMKRAASRAQKAPGRK
jgi:hypothetical protein